MADIRLTQFSHGGGCGCKISPQVLASILGNVPHKALFPALLVGAETSDDAAVYRLNDQQALVATTDFFMPIVDDAHDFGRIAATNALSDIYAMGATPIMALAIVGMPVNQLPLESIRQILAGGEAVCAAAGIPLAGGHSIDSPEPIYGLVAMGLVHPDRIKRNSQAQAGDHLVLGKPLGIGILAQAMKKGLLDGEGYRQLIAVCTRLNTVGSQLASLESVHALTDVTGFGLAGHLLEMCRAASLRAEVSMTRIPLLPAARHWAEQGLGPGAIERNLQSVGQEMIVDPALPDWQKRLLADPQTSGGLLVSVSDQGLAQVLALFHAAGFVEACSIGRMVSGKAGLRVTP